MKEKVISKNMKQLSCIEKSSLSEEDLYASTLGTIRFVNGRCLNRAGPHLLYAILISYTYTYILLFTIPITMDPYILYLSELCLNIFTISLLPLKNDTDTKPLDKKEGFALCFIFFE